MENINGINGNNVIGKNISYLRRKKKLTQTELGKQIGKKNSVISAYEKGISSPPIDVLVKISQIFSMTIEDLASMDLTELKNQKIVDEIWASDEDFEDQFKDIKNKGINHFLIIRVIRSLIQESESPLIALDEEITNFISKYYEISRILDKWVLNEASLHEKIDHMIHENRLIHNNQENITLNLYGNIKKVEKRIEGKRILEAKKDLQQINELMTSFLKKNKNWRKIFKDALY